MRPVIIAGLICALGQTASADLYQIYFAQQSELGQNTANKVKIINTNSYTTYDGDMSGFYNRTYQALETAATNAWGEQAGAAAINDPSSAPITVLDFVGTKMKVRSNNGINIGSNSNDVFYDTVATIDLSNGTVTEQILIAKDQATYDIAVTAGYDVILDTSNIDRSGAVVTFNAYSENVTNSSSANSTTNGGFVTGQITGDDGATLFRQEDDGTVHIGENSIVLADELVSASGNDEIYSSSGVLQLGNNDSHRTIVRGTLEVPKPTAGSHAANKKYVDGVGAMAMAASQISLQADPNSSLSIGVGLGGLGNQSAFAFGLTGKDQQNGARYSLTAAYNDYSGEVGFGAAIVWSLR